MREHQVSLPNYRKAISTLMATRQLNIKCVSSLFLHELVLVSSFSFKSISILPAIEFEVRSFVSLSLLITNWALGRSKRSLSLSFFVNRNRLKSYSIG